MEEVHETIGSTVLFLGMRERQCFGSRKERSVRFRSDGGLGPLGGGESWVGVGVAMHAGTSIVQNTVERQREHSLSHSVNG